MQGNIYVWSDDSERSFILYDAEDNKGSLIRYDRSTVDMAIPIINKFIDKGYAVKLDQTWMGVRKSIKDDAKKALMKKLKMKKALYNKFKNSLVKILGIEKLLMELV